MPVEFSKISTPTLLVSGEYDKITPAELGERAADLNPKVHYALVKGTGHFPMLEDPENLPELCQGVSVFRAEINRFRLLNKQLSRIR
jgi:pimeloyl-ACP methyl ester carboxylesterase